MGVLAPGAKEEVIRQERMAFSFVHQTTTGKVCTKNKKEDVWASLKEKAGVKDGEHTQIA